MAKTIEVRVPNIGDFRGVGVSEVLIAAGQHVAKDATVITLESDKASMDVPAPESGVVQEVRVKVGDKVSEGDVIAVFELDAVAAAAPAPTKPAANAAPVATTGGEAPPPAPAAGAPAYDTDVLVLGGGPGGYTAAFRAADLGKSVVLVERFATLGGVCLNVGCIPSKALLNVASTIAEARLSAQRGVRFGDPAIDLAALRKHKEQIVGRLTRGLAQLAKKRHVKVVQGVGHFASDHSMQIDTPAGSETISFAHCIIAVGSHPVRLPHFPADEPRLIDSTGALELADVPARLLVIGGGAIGLEMATIYQALGSRISIVEMQDSLLPGTDADMVRPLERSLRRRSDQILLSTKVERIERSGDALLATFSGQTAPALFDRVLVAVGRAPNGQSITAQKAGVAVDARGFIASDAQKRTNVPHIFAIGDVTGAPLLAHKASHEGKVAAEVIAGHNVAFDTDLIPAVAYTDPEVAWVGLTEQAALARSIDTGAGTFPWTASGRALTLGHTEGLTKLVFARGSRRLVGGGVVGPHAGEIIGEIALAIEMGANADDVALTIHPHPTLSETVGLAAEAFAGTLTDL
jgi:dihydrolipoamide dehydrogenase